MEKDNTNINDNSLGITIKQIDHNSFRKPYTDNV